MANETQRYCKQCSRNILATRPSVNHVLHLLISLVTCGLWAVIWAGLAIRVGGWRCSVCGGAKLVFPK